MYRQANSKVVGAFIVGFALVAGAYTIKNFGKSTYEPTTQQATVAESGPLRVPIEVTDADNNGIEDWQDEFVTAEPIVLDEDVVAYVQPDTLTSKLGINLIQDVFRAKTYGTFGRSNEEIIDDTINNLAIETSFPIYDTLDIRIMSEWDNDDIRNYANAVAQAIIRNNEADLENELFILQDIMNRGDKSRLEEIKRLAAMYDRMVQDTLAIPVPAIFAKQHLDLINTYYAINRDVDAMTMSFDDPAFTLLRLKRYEDDVRGMRLAFENMYASLVPYASVFSVDDPALLFTVFSSNIRI